MRTLAALAMAAIALAACNQSNSTQQQQSQQQQTQQPQHAWQDAPIGTRIRSSSATAVGDTGTTTDTTFLQNLQRGAQMCSGASCGN
jgi:Tfp pilus assembly protein PilV